MSYKADQSEILTLKQVADYLKVTERTIYRLAAAKKVPAFKVGGTWRFSRAAIAGWIKLQSTEQPATDRGDDNTSDSQKTDAQGEHK